MLRAFLASAALSALLQFPVKAGSNVVVESLPGVPEGWTKLSDADPSQMIRLRIALKQPGLDRFEQTLYAVSSPSSPQYGMHLKRDELREMLKPHQDSTAAVLQWLEDAGIPQTLIEDDSDWINLVTTVRNASALLDASFGVYGHQGGSVKKVRALKYSVPQNVRPHITMVAPVIRFPQVKPLRSLIRTVSPAESSIQASDIPSGHLNITSCNRDITPECLRALYQIGSYQAEPSERSLFGISGYLKQLARYDQLAKFQKTYAPYTSDANFSVVSLNGGITNQTDDNDSVEANLDVQYALSLSYKTNIMYYSTGGLGEDLEHPGASTNEPYLDFLDYLTKLPDDKLPQTLTTSYGEDEQSVPREFAIKVCNTFGELGARGVSVFFSSGDAGPGGTCQDINTNATRFMPTFPGACPYVTSVGGTVNVNPERGGALSAGGFSDFFARPAYQEAAVSKYLGALGDRWKGLYNPAGRGFPDIAAQAYSYHIFDQNRDVKIGGTSASSPVVASIFALLNNARLKAGKPPMGFVNPWLYEVGFKGLTDITTGGSRGCLTGPRQAIVPYASWNATEGWDPATGLGTPLFDKLLQLSSPGYQMAKIGQ